MVLANDRPKGESAAVGDLSKASFTKKGYVAYKTFTCLSFLNELEPSKQWDLVGLVFDALSGVLKFYRNGEKFGSQKGLNDGFINYTWTDLKFIHVGMNSNGGRSVWGTRSPRAWVELHDYAMNATEVQNHYFESLSVMEDECPH